MAERKALVRIAAKVDASVRKALRGVTEDTQKVTQETEKSTRKRAQLSERAARQAQKGLRDTGAAAQREALRQEAIARRVANTKVRESRRSTESELRDLRRLTREQGGLARAAARGGGRGLALGAVAAGAYHGGKGLVTEAQAGVGAGTLASRQQKAIEFWENLVRKGLESGLQPEELEGISSQITAAAHGAHQDPIAMVEALAYAQTQFAAFRDFIPLLEDMGRVATASGTDIRALVGMLGTAKKIFGLTSEEMREAMYFMVQSARNGAVSVDDLSSSMAQFFGEFKAYSGQKGLAGFYQMAGTFQATQASLQADPRIVGTHVRALFRKLTQESVQRKLWAAGVPITTAHPREKGAELLSPEEIIKRFAEAQKAGKWDIQKAQKILVNEEAVGGLIPLVTTVIEEPEYFKKVAGASAKEGRELSDLQYRTLVESPAGAARAIGIEAQIKAITTMEEVARVDTVLAKKVTELQAEFPVLAKVLGSLETTIQALIGALVLRNLLGGGGGLFKGLLGGAGGLFKGLLGGAGGRAATTAATTVATTGAAGTLAGGIGIGSITAAGGVLGAAYVGAKTIDIMIELKKQADEARTKREELTAQGVDIDRPPIKVMPRGIDMIGKEGDPYTTVRPLKTDIKGPLRVELTPSSAADLAARLEEARKRGGRETLNVRVEGGMPGMTASIGDDRNEVGARR